MTAPKSLYPNPEAPPAAMTMSQQPKGKLYKALYSYEARHSDELSFKEGLNNSKRIIVLCFVPFFCFSRRFYCITRTSTR